MPGVRSQGPSEAPKGAERMRQPRPLSHLLSLGFSKLGLTMHSANIQRRRRKRRKRRGRDEEGGRVLDLISLNLMQ